jgi:trans-aconitate methyltransferase
VVAKLDQGAQVADVGCGHGASTILMARAFPNSSFTGSDYHQGSIADVVGAAGFTRFRRVAETPFNLVFEARP